MTEDYRDYQSLALVRRIEIDGEKWLNVTEFRDWVERYLGPEYEEGLRQSFRDHDWLALGPIQPENMMELCLAYRRDALEEVINALKQGEAPIP